MRDVYYCGIYNSAMCGSTEWHGHEYQQDTFCRVHLSSEVCRGTFTLPRRKEGKRKRERERERNKRRQHLHQDCKTEENERKKAEKESKRSSSGRSSSCGRCRYGRICRCGSPLPGRTGNTWIPGSSPPGSRPRSQACCCTGSHTPRPCPPSRSTDVSWVKMIV